MTDRSGNPGITLLHIALDGSGSMTYAVAGVVQGVAELLKEQQANGHDELLVGFTTFGYGRGNMGNSVSYYPPRPIEELPVLGSKQLPYGADGGTPLYDGIGITLKQLDEDLAKMPPEQRPGRVVIFVQTDGGEGGSNYYSNGEILRMVKQYQARGWEFIWAGQNDAWREGLELGFKHAISYQMVRRYNSAGISAGIDETPDMLRALSLASTLLRQNRPLQVGRLDMAYFRRLGEQMEQGL